MYESMEDLKEKLSAKEFIKLYEDVGSSRKLSSMLGVSRSGLEHYYQTLTFKPYSKVKKCKKCGKEFEYLVKTHRDAVRLCSECKKDITRKINEKYIKGKPSHRRISNRETSNLEALAPFLENTFFVGVEAHPESEKKVILTCTCGNKCELSIKEVRRSVKTNKKSCGCKRNSGISFQEQEIQDFIENLGEIKCLRNKKPSFMNGLELDLYLPDKKIAIEFHGLAHHSERPIHHDKDLHTVKTRHETKYLLCKAAGVRLIQIYQDEWEEKPEIVKSILRNALGFSEPLNARDCVVQQLPGKFFEDFQDATHIAGFTTSIIGFGLYHAGDLVSVLTLRNTWNKSYGDKVIEIARFSSKLNTNVRGGFSRLLKSAEKWARNAGYDAILSYADCRWGSGSVYVKNGFTHLGKTKPNYSFEKGGIRESRFKHRKNPNLAGETEREQQNRLGWYAIWDAGSEIYFKKCYN